MSPRQPRPIRHSINHDRWLVSYADFITLLFAFFVVLYAFAKADEKKQREVSAAIDTAFRSMGILADGSRGIAKGAGLSPLPKNAVLIEQPVSQAMVKDDLNRMKQELERSLAKEIGQHSVAIGLTREGLVISLREAGFFDSGSANPKPATLPALREIAAKLGESPYDLRIEGHTDNVPIHSAEFDSNWELSSARATRIARLFLGMKALAPERIAAAGYAEYHPVASNDTAEGRAQNRRVDLVILPHTKIDLGGAEYAPSRGAWRKVADDDEPATVPKP
jgi:chemotaxis protein MotB